MKSSRDARSAAREGAALAGVRLQPRVTARVTGEASQSDKGISYRARIRIRSFAEWQVEKSETRGDELRGGDGVGRFDRGDS